MDYPRFGLASTSQFTKVWDDSGSRAKLNFGIWRPTPAPFGFLGDYPVEGHGDPSSYSRAVYIKTILDDDPAKPALKPPTSLKPIWYFPYPRWGFDNAKVICQPVAPNGYVVCGFVGVTARPNEDINKLHVPGLMCVRSDLIVGLENPPNMPLRFGDYFVWNDHGSRLPDSVSVFRPQSYETGIATMWAVQKYMTSKDKLPSYQTIKRPLCFEAE
ncbi:MAG TPA: Vps62-related protein [Allosphingosinicella sp.]|jgi:hypothetical protein